jgi:hypothetical protein
MRIELKLYSAFTLLLSGHMNLICGWGVVE